MRSRAPAGQAAAADDLADASVPEARRGTPLRRLLPYHRRYWLPFWLGITGLLLARVFEALIPLYLRDGIDLIEAGLQSGESTRAMLMAPAVAILICVLLRYLFIAASRRVIRRIGIAIAYDLRNRFYAQVQRMGPAFFARHPTGDLMARAVNDIQLIRQLIGMGLRTILVLVFSAGVGLAFMFSLAPMLTLMLLPPLPIIVWAGWRLSRQVFDQSIIVQAGFSNLSDRVQENLGGIRTVQAQVQEAKEIERFAEVNQAYADSYLELSRINSLIASIMPLLGALCVLVILGYGGSQVLAGELTLGTLTAFLWYLNMVMWPVRQAGQMVTLWQQGASGTQRLFEVLDAEPEVADAPNTEIPLPAASGAVQAVHLAYRFPDADTAALDDVSFALEPGEFLAVMGPVGAGKTTLLRCLARLIDPPRGSLVLDGVDVRDYPLAELRSRIVLVPQDPFLFGDLLRSNLSYDSPDRDSEQIEAAAAAAGLGETLTRLPYGLDTLVGERGVTLSGGQKQRTSLARGLIQTPAVLLLDDCFSSVDTETEAKILAALRSMRTGQTTILVTHRVATARQADRVLVLDEGAVLELGTHAELLAAGGAYATLERLQGRRERLRQQLHEGGEV